jgi:hypothetical protein
LKKEITVVVNSQIEYWTREFKANVIVKDITFQSKVLDLIAQGIVPVIQLDNDPEELEFLKALPVKSIIGWSYSDESFNVSFARQVSQLESLAAILRPYHLNTIKIRNLVSSIKYFLSNLRNVGSFENVAKFVLWYFRGIGMYRREREIKGIFEHSNLAFVNFPLGYTDVFCHSFLSVVSPSQTDITESLFNITPPLEKYSKSHLVFVGQVGQIVRKVAIKAAQKSNSSTVLVRVGYGAFDINGENVRSNGIEYVRLLLNSRFILCPPGNISGNSFRIHESVIARRIPLVLSHVSSDPNFIAPICNVSPYSGTQSWNKTIVASKLISYENYCRQVRNNLNTFQLEVLRARDLILEFSKRT